MSNEERIAVLELQYRNMKRIVLGISAVITLNFAICSIIIVGFVVSTTNVTDVIQAKKFEVVNDEGMVVAGIYSAVGGGYLSVRNKDGKPVVAIFGDIAGGAAMSIQNRDGKPVAQISADAHGGSLDVSNKDGKTVALISADADGGGAVKTMNSKGEVTSKTP